MEFFFKPAGIALIGATADERKGGFSLLKNLMNGFDGKIYPVNPRYDQIAGLPCYDSVSNIPDPADLAIIFVPAPKAPELVADCATRGISGVMIQSAGFAETGPEGKKLQDQLSQISRDSGIRIWGPNCMGLVDAVNQRVFSFVSPVIWDGGLLPGHISLIVQSGMLSAGFLMDTMTRDKTGISKVCSIGNKVDVNESDVLEYLLKDPNTRVVGLYLESVLEGRRFFHICQKAEKPIVVLQGGKSLKGARAAQSHTASMAVDSAVFKGAMNQAGVFQAEDFRQMMHMANALSLYGRKGKGKTSRIAVVTFSGGAGIVSGDLLDRHHMVVANLSDETQKRIQKVFPDWMPAQNPVDLWPAIERSGVDKTYGDTMRAVCADPNVDAILLHTFVGGLVWQLKLAPIVETAQKAGKPLFIWMIGKEDESAAFNETAKQLGIPVFREIKRAVECMAAVLTK